MSIADGKVNTELRTTLEPYRQNAMISNLSQAIAESAKSDRYLSDRELGALEKYFNDSRGRLDVARFFSNNSSALASDALRLLLSRYPGLIDSNGVLYDQRKLAACIRDLDLFLRAITYSVLSRDSRSFHDNLLNGLRETYISLGIPLDLSIIAVSLLEQEVLKRIAHAVPDQELHAEIAQYFKLIRLSLE
jgi:hypothetical protein